MPSRTKISFTLAHLALVALGAAQIEVGDWGLVGRVLSAYGSLSGSTSGYSFFAPGVGSPMRASFDITESDGKTVTEDLGIANREVALRVGNIVEAFRDQIDDEAARRSLAASWAGHVLARHPRARAVRVRLEEYDLPTMAGLRQGEETGWEPIYGATFRRSAR